MEQEIFISGYCRQIDQSRQVLVELYDGDMDVACDYYNCPYAPNCTVAQKIDALTAKP